MRTTYFDFGELAFVQAVYKVALENQHLVYEPIGQRGCMYTSGGPDDCGCLFGRALVRLGVATTVLEAIDAQPYDRAINRVLRMHTRFPEVIIDWAQAVQRNQDKGQEWWDSVKSCEGKLPMSFLYHLPQPA